MDLIIRQPRRYHVSQDTVADFEGVIGKDPAVRVRELPGNVFSLLPNRAWAAMTTVYAGLRPSPAVAPKQNRERDFFSVMMGLNLRKVLPEFLHDGRKSVYLFDAWPAVHDTICDFARAFRVGHLFFSSRQAAETIGRRLPLTSCEWVPEGVIPEQYHHRPTGEKDIDVLQIGRRFDSYHDAIVGPLQEAGRTYLYEKQPWEIIFPTREAYLDGLARAKISICVPATLTHPTRAGGIETMTLRYLQSMASRCLPVGHAPREMIDLFGYNPVLEIDSADPARQLLGILADFGAHEALIERNYQAVVQHQTWQSRWSQIRARLSLGTPELP